MIPNALEPKKMNNDLFRLWMNIYRNIKLIE